MRTRQVALISTFTALGVAMRIAKHAAVGALQFFNAPLCVAMVAGWMAGPGAGALTGFLTFLLSDMLIWLGPWTPINGALAAALGAAWSLLRRDHSRTSLFVAAFLTTFAYDIASSVLGYLIYLPAGGLSAAVTLALIGLFLPAGGGWLVGVGPITESVTAAVTVAIIEAIRRQGPLQGSKGF